MLVSGQARGASGGEGGGEEGGARGDEWLVEGCPRGVCACVVLGCVLPPADVDSKKAAPTSTSAPQVRSWKAVQGMRVNGDDVTLSDGIKVRARERPSLPPPPPTLTN